MNKNFYGWKTHNINNLNFRIDDKFIYIYKNRYWHKRTIYRFTHEEIKKIIYQNNFNNSFYLNVLFFINYLWDILYKEHQEKLIINTKDFDLFYQKFYSIIEYFENQK